MDTNCPPEEDPTRTTLEMRCGCPNPMGQRGGAVEANGGLGLGLGLGLEPHEQDRRKAWASAMRGEQGPRPDVAANKPSWTYIINVSELLCLLN